MKKKIIKNYIAAAILLVLMLAFVAKFAGPEILKLYIKTGVGDCRQIPILCREPEKNPIGVEIDKEFAAGLIPHRFLKMDISIPKGFSIVQQTIKKIYYKRSRHRQFGAVVYVLARDPNFFITLFPQVKSNGVYNDYEFIRRLMYANIEKINTLHDAFFVIMKGIFTPDLGNQNNVTMVNFVGENIKGFANYSLEKKEHYFDFNLFDNYGNFFKVYIKDQDGKLDFTQAMTVISTIISNNN